MIEIIARKSSSDPVQEHLREHKAEWNEGISAFIKALIALKQATNGRQVAELSIAKGNIKDPLPDVIPVLLDRLAGEYQKLTQDGKNIVQEQEQYSQHRRKPQEKHQVASVDDSMIKEGSNSLTRLWTYVSTPFRFSDEDRWAKKNMLQASEEVQRRLSDIGVYLVSSEPNSIPNAFYSIKTLMHLLESGLVKPMLALNEAKLRQALKDQSTDIKSTTGPIKSTTEPIKPTTETKEKSVENENKLEDSYHLLNSMEDDIRKIIVPNLERISASIGAEQVANPNIALPIQELDSEIRVLIPDFYASIERKDDFLSIQRKYNEIKGKYNTILLGAGKLKLMAKFDSNIQKFAKHNIQRWLGRKKLEIFKQQDYRLRLDADRYIRDSEDELDKFMNVLQKKDALTGDLVKCLSRFAIIINRLLAVIIDLADVHNSYIKLKKLNGNLNDYNIINISDIKSLERMSKKFEKLERFVKD